MILRQLYWRSH